MLPDLHVLHVLDVVRLGERPEAQPKRRVVAAILKLVAEVGRRQKNHTRPVSALMLSIIVFVIVFVCRRFGSVFHRRS